MSAWKSDPAFLAQLDGDRVRGRRIADQPDRDLLDEIERGEQEAAEEETDRALVAGECMPGCPCEAGELPTE